MSLVSVREGAVVKCLVIHVHILHLTLQSKRIFLPIKQRDFFFSLEQKGFYSLELAAPQSITLLLVCGLGFDSPGENAYIPLSLPPSHFSCVFNLLCENGIMHGIHLHM